MRCWKSPWQGLLSERSGRHVHAAFKNARQSRRAVGNCRGFVGNRMFGPYRREAQFLIEEGAGIEAVDQALFRFRHGDGTISPLVTLAGSIVRLAYP